MDYNEFNALTRGLRSIPGKKNPSPKNGAGTDASAIHGRPSAQVALLQSPILSAVRSPYIKRRIFRGLPVDKPHTCNPCLDFISSDATLDRYGEIISAAGWELESYQ